MKRALLAIIGGILGLTGLGFLVIGGILLAVFGTDGEAAVPIGSVASPKGRAVVINNFQIDAADSLPLNESWFDLKLQVTGNQSHFVGVAPKKDSLRYLQGVPYELITGVDSSSGTLKGTSIPGSSKPEPPEAQTIWDTKETGDDTTVTWPVSNVDTSLVVMNEDLSSGVAADVNVDVRIAWASGAGIGLVVAGILAVVVGIIMLAMAMRSKPQPAEAALPSSDADLQG